MQAVYRYFFILLHVLTAVTAALAHPGSREQFSTDIIHAILKDRRGMVWVGGTKGLGLLQPMGINWFQRSIRGPILPLPGDVEKLSEDDLGRLWMVLSTGGIMRYQPDLNQFVSFPREDLPLPLRAARIRALRPLGFAHLLVCTESGAFVMNGQLRTIFPLPTDRWPDKVVVDGMAFNGHLFLLLESGSLVDIQVGHKERVYANSENRGAGIRLDTLDGRLYLSLSAGLCQWSEDKLQECTVYLQGKNIGRDGIIGVLSDCSQNTFVCSRVYGPLQLQKKLGNQWHVSMTIIDKGIEKGTIYHCVHFDEASHDWFIATSAGFLRNDRLKRVSRATMLPGHTIRAIFPHAGTLFFSTNSRVGQVIDTTVQWLSTEGLDRDPAIEHIFSMANGRIFGVGNNVYEFKDGSVQVPPDLPLQCSSETEIWADRLNDSVMYILLPRRNLLARWKAGTDDIKLTPSTEWATFNPPALAYRGKYLFYADGSQIKQYNLLANTVTSLHMLQSELVQDIKTDGRNIYFAIAHGAHIYEPEAATWHEIDFGPELQDDEVTNIEIIGREICYATRNGFGVYHLTSHSNYYFPLDHHTSLGNLAAYSSSRIRNEMVVGGFGGFLRVFPDSLFLSKRLFKVFLIDCWVHQQGRSVRKELAPSEPFTADENHVEFLLGRTVQRGWSVSGLDYSLDDEPMRPVSSGDRIFLHGIAAGKHTLRVFDRETHQLMRRWNFEVLSPWYKSLWFAGLLLLAILLLQWLAIRPYLVRRRMKKIAAVEMEKQILHERERISAELHDDLGSGLSTIRLLADLVKHRVSELALKNELEEIIGEAMRLNDNLRDLVWSLNPEEDELPKMIQYFAACARKFLGNAGVQTEINVQEIPGKHAVFGSMRRQLVLVFKEMLNNVVKHSKAKKVRLDFQRCENTLHIHLEDNGTGILLPGEPGSRGMQNMSRRMERLGGQITWHNGNGGGTIVDLELPLSRFMSK